MKRRTRAALAALFAFSVAGLTACGSEPAAEEVAQVAPANAQIGGAAEVPAEPPPEPAAEPGDAPKEKKEGKKDGPRPVETVGLAYEKTTEAQTAKVTMLMEFSGLSQGGEGPDSYGMRMDGMVDFEKDVSSFTMSLPMLGPVRVRQVGDDLYEKLPEPLRSEMPENKPWIKVDLADMAGGPYGAGGTELKDGSPTSLDGQLEYLRGVSDSVEEIGMDPVRGVSTTHYRAEVDLADAAGGDEQTRQAFETLRDQTGAETIDLEMWVDADGRVRRSIMDVPMENLGAVPGSDGTRMKIEQEMYDFGDPVNVEAPPAEETIEMNDLERITRDAAS